MKTFLTWLSVVFALGLVQAAEQRAELNNLSVNGGIEDGKARLVIEALLKGTAGEGQKPIFATESRSRSRHRLKTSLSTSPPGSTFFRAIPRNFR